MQYLVAILAVLLGAFPAFSEVVCVAKETGYLRELPALETPRVVLEVPRYYPLVVTGSEGEFREAADYWGRRGWIEDAAVDRLGCAVVARDRVNIRGGSSLNDPVIMKAPAGVAFRVLDLTSEWARVRHESGREGWIHRSLLWGVD